MTAIVDLPGTDLGTHSAHYEERDAILYAVAVGASPTDLSLVYERDLKVLSTFALTLGLWTVEAAGRLGVYDPTTSLHVSQTLDVHEALPRNGKIEMSGRITSVWDRGNAAIIDVGTTSDYFSAVYSIYLPDHGGFGGTRPERTAAPEEASPIRRAHYQTIPEQAILYRLTGDRHPVHVDPEVAAASGFDRPILHGLCTLGIAVLQVSKIHDCQPTAIEQLQARLAAPVLPGDDLQIETSRTEYGATFTASVDDKTVLKGGHLSWSRDH